MTPGGEGQLRVDEVDSENPLRPRYTGAWAGLAAAARRGHGLGMGGHLSVCLSGRAVESTLKHAPSLTPAVPRPMPALQTMPATC